MGIIQRHSLVNQLLFNISWWSKLPSTIMMTMEEDRRDVLKKKTCDVIDGGSDVAEEKLYQKYEGHDQLSSKKGESMSNTLPLRKIHHTRSGGVVRG